MGFLDGLFERLEIFVRAHVPAEVLDLAQRMHILQLGRSVVLGAIIYGAALAVIYLLERRAGVDGSRYRTRHFANDVAYTIFYKGGFYAAFLLAAITNLFESHLPFFRFHLLEGVPWPIGLALFWVGGDFITYWWHRFQHSNRVLWAFHSVHHSQEHLTLFTASRRHPLENLSMDVLLYFVVFHFLLGVPTRGWVPLTAALRILSMLHHSQLDWRLGPFARLIVSPRFHSFHHSAEPRHAGSNFGQLFSCWDYLFGTAVPDEPRPARYGVDGLPMEETLWSQLVTPFRLLRGNRSAPAPAVAARSEGSAAE